MVDIGLMRIQREYFQQHREEIFQRARETNSRFAMIPGDNDKVEYFPDRKLLYNSYPSLAPGASPIFGNSPMFVDIGKETNSIEYRREQLKERKKKVGEDLERIVKEYIEIMDETKKLKN